MRRGRAAAGSTWASVWIDLLSRFISVTFLALGKITQKENKASETEPKRENRECRLVQKRLWKDGR